MGTRDDLWLDADRDSGETVIRLTAEDVCAAHEQRLLQGGGTSAHVYGSPISLLSHRAFEVTALRCGAQNRDTIGSLTVIRGCFNVLTVNLQILLDGTEETYAPRLPWRWPAKGPWPTRLFNPARQNLSFLFDHAEPCEVTVFWRHIGKES